MSIFDKIKKMLKNIGNKQKLLEGSTEISEEMYGRNIGGSSKKESEFLEDLKFDPNDLLDPRVCNGKNLVPNILKSLGANEDVIKNPQIMDELKSCFSGIMDQNGIEMPMVNEQLTRENINTMVEAVKNNRLLTTVEERFTKRNGMGTEKTKCYKGINIDKETGAVTIQKIIFDSTTSGKTYMGSNWGVEDTFSPDGKGNVVGNSFRYYIDNNGYGKTRLTSNIEALYNPDGLMMNSESKFYEQESENDVLKQHSILTRDEQYPFITKEKTIVNDLGHGPSVGTMYNLIEMKNLATMNSYEWQKDEDGNRILESVAFENREQIAEYYKENKENIDNALMAEPDCGVFTSSELRKSLQAGIRKLGVKAGLLPKESEKGIGID